MIRTALVSLAFFTLLGTTCGALTGDAPQGCSNGLIGGFILTLILMGPEYEAKWPKD